MQSVIENGVLKKGVYLNDKLYIPEGVRKIDRHAFPLEKFITLKNDYELDCSITIWFSGADEKTQHSYYCVFCERDIYPGFIREFFRKHGVYCTDDDYHQNFVHSPEFQSYLKRQKRKTADALCHCINALFHRLEDRFVIFPKYDIGFQTSDEKDGYPFHFWTVCDLALDGLEADPGCYAFLKRNAKSFNEEYVRKLISYRMTDKIRKVCDTDLIPENYIDMLIQKAIDEAQYSQNYEIQLLLMHYKAQHFHDSDPMKKFEL